MAFKPRWLVIHHTQGWWQGQPTDLAAILRERGLKGYHWCQYCDDSFSSDWRMAALTRGDLPGEHVAGHNSECIGYAFIGNFQAEPPSDTRLAAAAIDCAVLLRLYGLTPADMIAHRDVPDNDTSCPGLAFSPALFEQFRTKVAEQYEIGGA